MAKKETTYRGWIIMPTAMIESGDTYMVVGPGQPTNEMDAHKFERLTDAKEYINRELGDRRGPGRPPKAPEDRRSIVVNVRLTPGEHAALKAIGDVPTVMRDAAAKLINDKD